MSSPTSSLENDTVVAAADDFLPLFENILRVLPSTKTIAIVSGASPNERFWQGVLKRDLQALAGRVEIKWLNELSFEDILKETAKLPPSTAIFFQLMNVDATGVVFEGGTALTRLAATANRPVFTYDDAFFGDGILGGPMASVDDLSKKAAAVALRILDGEKAGDIKNSSDRPCIAEIRLASNAALWDQRERPSAGEHGFLQAAYGVGNLPLADRNSYCRPFASSRSDRAPSARAATPSFGRNRVESTNG